MDASCFLTSKSFTKSPFFNKTRRQGHPPLCTKFSCNVRRSGDETEPSSVIDSDWRSFRARLVAAEQSSTIAMPPTITTAASDQPKTTPFTIGDKWAHALHEPEKGCLLVATERLDGVHIFERTVVLLLATGPIGPTGVILNRPSLMSIKETQSMDADVAGVFSDRPLFFGGPLEKGLFLVGPVREEEEEEVVRRSGVFEEVMKGLYYGNKESVGCAAEMVKRAVVKVEEFRFFDGYCGWEKEQLREEIRAGYWSVVACSPSVVGIGGGGGGGGEGLWEEVLGLVGQRKVW